MKKYITPQITSVSCPCDNLLTTSNTDVVGATEITKSAPNTAIFNYNYYSNSTEPERFKTTELKVIDKGIMIVNPSDSNNGKVINRIVYISESTILHDSVLYAVLPNLKLIRLIFKFAKDNDKKFDYKQYTLLDNAIDNDFSENNVRFTEREIKGKNQYFLAMTLKAPFSEILKLKSLTSLEEELNKFWNECDNIIKDIKRFEKQENFQAYIEGVKKAQRNKKENIATFAVFGKVAWMLTKLFNGSGGGSDDKWIDKTMDAIAGVDIDLSSLNLEMLSFDGIDFDDIFNTDFLQLDGNDVQINDCSLDSIGNVVAETDTNIVDQSFDSNNSTDIPMPEIAQENEKFDTHSDNEMTESTSDTVNTPTTGQVLYNQQPDGTVIVTDIFGGEHRYMSMEEAYANTDIMSGIPGYEFPSMPSSSSAALSTTDLPNDNYNPRDDYSAKPFEDSKHDQIVFEEQSLLQKDAVEKYKEAIDKGNVEEAGKWEKIALDAEHSKQAHSKFYPTYGLDDRTLAGLDK